MEAVLNGPFGQMKLGRQPLTIGRTPDNQLSLTEPKVSSNHAEILPEGQDYAIVDLGSTNGTIVNDQRLASNQPRVLHSGDIVVIGDTRFTYDVIGASETEPTRYAASWQGNNASNTPAVAASPFYTGYGADAQQPGVYSPPASPGYEQASYAQGSPYYGAPVSNYNAGTQAGVYQAPPPPAYADIQQSGYPQGASYPGMPVAPPAPRPNRRRLWIIVGAIGGLVVIAILLFVVIGYVNRATPTSALNAYCNALKSGDYHSAYNQLSSSQQGQQTEAQFAANFKQSQVANCSVSNVNDSAGTGTISYTLTNGVSLVADYSLVNENSAWKIKAEHARSSPTLTLAAFCNALKVPDYQAAYNQFSSTFQSQTNEVQFADFAAILIGNKVTSCTLKNVNDTAGTGTVSYTFANGGSLVVDYTLVNENNAWKIEKQQSHSAPVLTLANFCYALETGDYQTAYNQLSSSEQSGITEPQLAAALSSNSVTKCTVSNINDAAGTGTVSYTFNRGNTSVIAYTLINDNGIWKINSGKQIG